MRRYPYFDFLRFVAVLLVIGRHWPLGWIHEGKPELERFLYGWKTGGWCGVDLFFVLSGFLVSGLLFNEYTRFQTVDLKRFFIRRAFKIFPPYLAFWLPSGVIAYYFGLPVYAHVTVKKWLLDLSFVQNFFPGVWHHTWSLAVEEHFYLFIAFFIFSIRNRIRYFYPVSVFILVATLLLRNHTYLLGHPVFFYTHTRIDSLLFGALLSYFYHFTSLKDYKLKGWQTLLLVVLGVLMASPNFFRDLKEGPYIFTYGLTVNYLASGFLVMAAVLSHGRYEKYLGVFNLIGRSSYSVYLWHVPILWIFWYGLESKRTFGISNFWQLVIYMITTIAVGIAMTKLIEGPALRFRDRIFPRSEKPASENLK
jgi:peptidoglycan/LPS O-acetylase OafA/YrhL